MSQVLAMSLIGSIVLLPPNDPYKENKHLLNFKFSREYTTEYQNIFFFFTKKKQLTYLKSISLQEILAGKKHGTELHFIQSFFISSKTKNSRRSKQEAKHLPSTQDGGMIFCSLNPEASFRALPSSCLLLCSQNALQHLVFSLQHTLKGLAAPREHVTDHGNTFRGWEAFQPGRHAKNISLSAQLHVRRALLVLCTTTLHRMSQVELICTVPDWELFGATPPLL